MKFPLKKDILSLVHVIIKVDEDDFIDFVRNDDRTEENKLLEKVVELFKKLWKNYAAEDKGVFLAHLTY